MARGERGREDVEAMATVDLFPKHARRNSPNTRRISTCTRPGQRTTPMIVLAKLVHGVLHDITKSWTRWRGHAPSQGRCVVTEDVDVDEDIITLDMSTPLSFLSCNSSPTQLPCYPQIQQTRHQCFDHYLFIRHRNGKILDSLERGQRCRHFRSSPTSRWPVD